MRRPVSPDALQAIVVDDHLALRKGVQLLMQDAGVRVTGVAAAPAEATSMILARRPDVVLLDLALDGGSGLDVAAAVLAEWPQAGILVYTGGAIDRETARAALASGIRGFALKAGAPAELLAAVRTIAAGGHYVDPRLAAVLAADASEPVHVLSPREREILDLVAHGLTSDAIAERLVLSPLTVETHVRNLMQKLGAHSRVHALAIALRLREIELIA